MNKMRFNALTVSLALAAIVGCGGQPSGSDGAADFVITNGKIYTVNESQPWAEAVAARGDEIVYVGDDAGAEAFVGEGTEEVDLEGRLLLPGFVESHFHAVMGGGTTSGVILAMSDSVDEVLAKVKAYAEAHPEKKTVFGASYNGLLFDARGPNKALLDEIVPDRPVFLMDHTLHSVWVNSKALNTAGVTKDTPNPPGGQYIRDASGEATGSIQGGPAHMPVLVAVDAINAESMRGSLPTVLEGLSEFGFTTILDMGAPIATESGMQAMIDLDEAGQLPVRASLTHYINSPAAAEDAVETLSDYAGRFASDHVWLDTLKITIDSVLENQGAAMLEPYLSTGDRGSLYLDHEQMKKVVLEAAEAGYNITVHAIGDRAVREALDAAAVLRDAGHTDTLYSITHTQMVQPEDRPRFGELDVTVQSTGNWAMQQPSYPEHIGQERNDTLQFPFRSWIDGGATLALGSDWPATPGGFGHGVNPFNNIYTSMHRIPPAAIIGELGAGDQPLPPLDQVLSLEEAVHGYTLGGAIMLGIEDEIGSIEVGKKADMILLSQNIFEIDPEQIPNTKVLATMFDGKVVHDIVYELGDSELAELDDHDVEINGLCGPTSR